MGSEAVWVRRGRINTTVSNTLSLTLSYLPPPPQHNTFHSSALDICEHSLLFCTWVSVVAGTLQRLQNVFDPVPVSISVHWLLMSSVVSLSLSGPLNPWEAQFRISLMHELGFTEATSFLVKLPPSLLFLPLPHTHTHTRFLTFVHTEVSLHHRSATHESLCSCVIESGVFNTL